MTVEFIAPLQRAWRRTVHILFRPFDLRTWLVIGFGAWLSGNGGCRGSTSFRDWSPPTGGGDFRAAEHWLMAHLWLVLAIAVPVVVVVVTLSILWMWLQARGSFVFLDNVARGRAAIAAPWGEHGALANSAFLWRLGFSIVLVAAMGLLALPFAVAAACSRGGATPFVLLLAIVPVAVVIALSAACVAVFFYNFVIPIMYRHRLKAVPAWGRFVRLFREHPGSFILFLLFGLVLAIAFGFSVVVAGLLTCCVGFIPLMIPYVGTVVLLPAWVVWRAFGLEFLAQFGAEYDGLSPLGGPSSEAMAESGEAQTGSSPE